MTYEEAKEALLTLDHTLHAYRHAMGVLSVDGATAAPKKSAPGRGETMGVLSGAYYELLVTDKTKKILDTVLSDVGDDRRTRRIAEVRRDEYMELTLVPQDEFVAYQTLLTGADAAWHEAKETSNFKLFAPYLEKIVAYNRKLAQRKDPERAPYDVLLDMYEKGASMAMLDPFFALLRQELSPVILAVGQKEAPRTDFLYAHCPVEAQRTFSLRLMDLMGIDRDRCAIAETEHPFTDGFNTDDVRITTNYKEDNFTDSMYSVIHEGGHAIYELGVDPDLNYTCVGGGSSMGIHESQSRFYENLIGRSAAFCEAVLPVARDCFPHLADVTAEDFYRAVNKAEPSLIRTEADELTYSIHVMIRYELEKQLMDGSLTVQELPAAWNRMYKDYLGVDVPDDRHGCLQDSHWSGGAIGYFPSYALGSAYGVQMLRAMQADVDVEACIRAGDLAPVTEWLRERIHRFGCTLTPPEVLENAIHEPFDPNVYVQYLKDKYTALYEL